MKTPLFVTFVLASSISICNGQNSADSLKQLLHKALLTQDKKNSLYYSAYLGYIYYSENRFDSSLRYYGQALRYEREFPNPKTYATVSNGIGSIYSKTGFLDSSAWYYLQAYDAFSSVQDTANVLLVESNLAIVYKDLGLYEKALETSFSVLSSLEKKAPSKELGSCLNTIGLAYSKIGDNESALPYFQRALAVRRQINYRKGEGQSYNSIAEAYMGLRLYDSALVNLNKSLSIKRGLGEKNSLPSTLNNIGDVLMAKGDIAKAEPYFKESLSIKREINDRVGQGLTLNNLGKLKLQEGKFTEAEKFLNEASDLIRQTESLEDLRVNLNLKVKLYKALGNSGLALKYSDELILIRDSLLTADKARSMSALRLEYETEKKEQQISLLQQKDMTSQANLRFNRILIWGLIIMIVFVFSLAFLIYGNFRLAKRSRQRVELLLQELNHRVKNNLQILSSILSLQSQQLKDSDAIQAVRSNEGRVNAMALIHRMLHHDETNRQIDIKTYVNELVQYLTHSYGFREDVIKLDLSVESVLIDVDKAIPVGLILNELISNSFKYAFADNAHPELKVRIDQLSKQKIKIEVGDNGPGITPGEKSSSAFGMKMVNTLIRELKGTYEVKSDNGTSYAIQIPLAL